MLITLFELSTDTDTVGDVSQLEKPVKKVRNSARRRVVINRVRLTKGKRERKRGGEGRSSFDERNPERRELRGRESRGDIST